MLAILAVLSIIGGWVGWPAALGGAHPTLFQRWLAPVLLPIDGHAFHFHEASHALEWTLMAVSVAVAALGIFLACRFYVRDARWATPKRLGADVRVRASRCSRTSTTSTSSTTRPSSRGTLAFCRVLWWIDTLDRRRHRQRRPPPHRLRLRPRLERSSTSTSSTVPSTAWPASAKGGSMMLRRVQSGLVQNYALIMGGGIVLIAMVYLFMKP